MKHLTVGELIAKLQECPSDAKVIIENESIHVDGMYYVTGILKHYENYCDEKQVEITSTYKRKAKGWEDLHK